MVSATEKADTLKLMTYNIRHGELTAMDSLAAYISSECPDIVALQECDWDTSRARMLNNGVRYVNELAYHTGMFGVHAKAIDFAGGYYGIGLLSRYPIVRYDRILLPNDAETEQRVMLVADIELPGGEVITFINTHLEFKSPLIRFEQIVFINEYIQGRSGRIFLAGDMNTAPDSEEMRLLDGNWISLTDDAFTFQSSDTKSKLDYIYVTRGQDVELLETDVREDVFLSDHFPVMSVVRLY